MKIQTKEFYYVNHAHDILSIDAHINIEIASSKPLPILWNNKGLFCIISRQKVQNMLDFIKDQEHLPVLNKTRGNVFHWSDGTLIDARIASKLLS